MQEPQETWVQSLGWEDPLEEEMATHSGTLAWRTPMDIGTWQATVHGVTKSWSQRACTHNFFWGVTKWGTMFVTIVTELNLGHSFMCQHTHTHTHTIYWHWIIVNKKYRMYCKVPNVRLRKENGQLMLKTPELPHGFQGIVKKLKWRRRLQNLWSAHEHSSDWLVVR